MNASKDKHVDHINGDRLDNRKQNLRLCTQTENNQNSRCLKPKTSAYKGVCWSKSKKKWIAQICANGKSIFIGHYNKEQDAAYSYNLKAEELHGDFARLNSVE
jgi:hypothetical protein